MNCPSAYETDSIRTPVSTWMPSAANASATTLLASGSTGPRMRSATSSTVTCTPKRENACASSAPIGPPPTTTSEPGASSARSTSRFVQYGVSASPSIGGAAGSVPVFSTTPFAAVYVAPFTSTVRGPVSRASPWTTSAPASLSRSTAIWSSQSVVASSRIRACTGAQSEVTVLRPANSGIRRPSASTSAARITIFEGMHP